ncbi:MAG: two-component system response regulator [Rhodothermaceae bacterium]
MKKIVIIDDSEEITSSLEDLLQTVGYIPFIASNATDGLNIIRTENPDLIISDIMMPVLDGFYVLQELKSDENISHIPVIVITAKTEKETLTRSMDSGANYFLEKPFSIKELLNIIESVFENV